MFRGDWKWAAIFLLANILTFALAGIVFSFLYNKMHIKDHLANGYKIKGVENGNMDMVKSTLKIPLPMLAG